MFTRYVHKQVLYLIVKKKEEEEEVSSDLMKTLPAAPASHSRGYADPLGPLFSTMCAQPCSSLDQQ